jgi:hypothetical protein
LSRIGISITKEVAFRDNQQEFSNVYYYGNGSGALPSIVDAGALIDQLVALEKTFHSSLVSFVHARLWSAGQGSALNEMLEEKTLTGTGSTTTDATMDKERTYMFQVPAGVDSRGKQVYLRKWYHSCGVFPGGPSPVGGTIMSNATGFLTANRTSMATNADDILTIGVTGSPGWALVSKNGRNVSAVASMEAYKYLEHHQLGNQWRG